MSPVSARMLFVPLFAAMLLGVVTAGFAQVPSQLSASHILIQYDGSSSAPKEVTRSKEEALALATKIVKMARAEGADFAALAMEYSDGPSGPKGGSLGTFKPKQMVAPFSNAVLALEIGEVSDPVETQFGYHIILRKEIKQASAKHILVSYKGAMRAGANIARSKEEALTRCEEVLAKIEAGEKFEDLAREYSDGPSARKGGDLGEFHSGQMAPPFEEATFACEVGKTTGIVETDFGYHIILRYQ